MRAGKEQRGEGSCFVFLNYAVCLIVMFRVSLPSKIRAIFPEKHHQTRTNKFSNKTNNNYQMLIKYFYSQKYVPEGPHIRVAKTNEAKI